MKLSALAIDASVLTPPAMVAETARDIRSELTAESRISVSDISVSDIVLTPDRFNKMASSPSLDCIPAARATEEPGTSRHFWLIRHGESTNNVKMDRIYAEPGLPAWKANLKFRLERDPDPALSDLGREQVAALHRHPALQTLLDSQKPVLLYSSPLRRALETAGALQKVLLGDNEVILKPSLVEGGGLYTTSHEDGTHIALPGATPSELQEAYPDVYLDVSEIPEQGWWSGKTVGKEGEDGPDSEFWQRAAEVARWMRELRPPRGVENIIVVGHGALFDKVMCEVLNVGRTLFQISHVNTGVTHLEFLNNSCTRVHCMNSPPVVVTTSSGSPSTM